MIKNKIAMIDIQGGFGNQLFQFSYAKYLEKKQSLESAVDEIKKNTRRYAKRQTTWFKNKKYTHYHVSRKKEIVQFILNYL